MRCRGRSAVIGVLLAAAGLLGTAAPGNAAPSGLTAVAAPRFVQAIGGPAHAEVAPSGLDVDPDGAVYAASTANDQVVKYGAAGNLKWKVGERNGRVDGSFLNPRDVAYLAGRVYVADTGYHRVQVLDATTGAWLATWDTSFSAPMGIGAGVDASGDPILLVSDSTAERVQTFTPSGRLLLTLGGGRGTALGQFDQVRDAATDRSGTIYTADFKNQRVQVFSAAGVPRYTFGSSCPGACPSPGPGQFKDPYGIAVDDAGSVYVSDNRRIQEFSPAGAFRASYGTAGRGAAQLFQLRRVAVGRGPDPAVYAADLWGYKVLRYDRAGRVSMTFGGSGPAATGLNQPYGLSLQGNRLLVADTDNQRIQVFSTSTGSHVGFFGERGFGADDLNGENWPRGVTYNAATDTIWVADTKNDRVVERDAGGVPTGRVFGSTGPVLRPEILNWVYGITSYGKDVIVADTFGNRIGRWTGNSATAPVWTYTGVTSPKAVAVSGNTVYVADSLAHRVVLLDARDGHLLSVLGAGVLHRDEGIAVAPDGTIWVADTAVDRLVQLSATGKVLQTFGTSGTETGQFREPCQLAVAPGTGGYQLYVTDTDNDRVQEFDVP